MSSRGHPGPGAIFIDLTAKDIDVIVSDATDLTSLENLQVSFNASHEPQVKVEDESATLGGSSIPDSGESSPQSQQDNDITQTESSATDIVNLSPGNTQVQDGSSSDDGLTLGTILELSKKRKRSTVGVPICKFKPTDASIPLTRGALESLVGSQPLKPELNKFFSVRNPTATEPRSEKSQQSEDPKNSRYAIETVEKERKLTENANTQILNIDREEVFGPEKKEKKRKHRSAPKSQEALAKEQVQVDGRAISAPSPRRAASEVPKIPNPEKKTTETRQFMKPSKPREEFESQRPHKRRKHGVQDNTASGSTSLATSSIMTKRQAVSVDKTHGHRPRENIVEAIHRTRQARAIEKPRGSTQHRPGDSRPGQVDRVRSCEISQEKLEERALQKANKTQHANPGRQREEKAYLMADQNEQGYWTPRRCQRAAVTSQKPLEGNLGQRATCNQSLVLHEAHEEPYRIDSDTTEAELLLGSNTSHAQPPLQLDQGLREAQGILYAGSYQLGKGHENDGQQKGHRIQSGLGTIQPAPCVSQHRQEMRLDEKDIEDTRAFFKNHPSQLAQQRKATFVDFVPPDVGKPSYPDRCLAIMRSSAGVSGPKRPAAIQAARKRERDRENQIRRRREDLEAQVNKEFPDGSEEAKQRRIEAGLAKLRATHARNDEKREAQKARGLLTVEYIEDREDADSHAVRGPSAASKKGKRRGIPLVEALEPGTTITVYAVFKSEPYEKGTNFSNYRLSRMEDQFYQKEDANTHAEAVLRDDRYDGSHLVSIQFRVSPDDGLFFGIKELADGKLVTCMVQSERQMSSDLNLREISVRKELKQIYCRRYDVLHTYVIPRVFLGEEEPGNDKEKKKGRKSDSKPKHKMPTTYVADDGPEPGEKEPVDEDSDIDSLFSGPPKPDAVSDHEEGVEAEDAEGGDGSDESDINSVDTDVTMEASQQGGELGALTWDDVEYIHEVVGSFTNLELANKEAARVALERWKPMGARMDSWLYYRDAIKPSLAEIWAQELDVEKADLGFDVPPFEGYVRDRPWPFICSRIYVRETRLQGPRDIGSYIVKGNGEDDGGQSDGGDGEDGEDN